MLSYKQLLSLVTTFGLLASSQAAPVWNPVVQTSKGQVTGLQTSDARRFTIPYAKPPVNALRFRRPEALGHWNGTLDGTQLPKACIQAGSTNAEQSEDCLYMNIYTPPNASADQKLPVFVWVHGGSFLVGETSRLDGSALATSQNMIVVTVQYRLGLFGWLKYDDWGLEGNMGLRDLILALETVQQDIGAFGGDSSLVTLAGQSSGAQMVKALLSTPSASPLFKRAIVQSAPLDYSPQPPALANAVGSAFLFNIAKVGQNQGYLFRLRKKYGEWFQAQQNLTVFASANVFGPGVPSAEPFNIVADGELVSGDGQQFVDPSKEVIFTTVKNEGCPSVPFVLSNLDPVPPFETIVGAFLPDRAQSILESGLYAPAEGDSDAFVDNLIQLATDFFWVCPNQEFASSAASKSKVYLGEFDLAVEHPTFPICDGKIAHEDDIPLLFSTPSSLSAAQNALVKEVQSRWASFARSGNPSPSSYPTWPALASSGGLQVLQLGATSKGGSSVTTSQRTDACKLYASA